MIQRTQPQISASSSRRDFLKQSTVLAGGLVAGSLAIGRSAHAAGSDTLKVGLIGCGGRGTGAAKNALDADKNTKLTAMGDAFADSLQASLKSLKGELGDRVDVPAERCFSGFDAYQKVIDSGVDVVILAEPPHFRPAHLKAAIAAGKHVFCEKPVAVDAPGYRSVLETTEEARKKNLNLVSGLCWRYYPNTRETMKRVLDGAIGDIMAMQVTYNAGELWHRGRKPEWSEMEYQMRNWYYFTWLSGDHNVEQHIHSLDKAAWAMRDEPPVKATGLGGRQVRTDAKYGNIFDHHAVVYEYANGVRLYSFCRQQNGCSADVSDHFMGTKGRCNVLGGYSITGETNWRYRGPDVNMYDAEHQELFASIRAGKTINNGQYMAKSTMLAILGRMATYTGQTITWEQAINSKENLTPAKYEWGPIEIPQVPRPGTTKFV
ncbi:MAG: Gfo/Idh/MocA family protein [Pirellulales bacterium]